MPHEICPDPASAGSDVLAVTGVSPWAPLVLLAVLIVGGSVLVLVSRRRNPHRASALGVALALGIALAGGVASAPEATASEATASEPCASESSDSVPVAAAPGSELPGTPPETTPTTPQAPVVDPQPETAPETAPETPQTPVVDPRPETPPETPTPQPPVVDLARGTITATVPTIDTSEIQYLIGVGWTCTPPSTPTWTPYLAVVDASTGLVVRAAEAAPGTVITFTELEAGSYQVRLTDVEPTVGAAPVLRPGGLTWSTGSCRGHGLPTDVPPLVSTAATFRWTLHDPDRTVVIDSGTAEHAVDLTGATSGVGAVEM